MGEVNTHRYQVLPWLVFSFTTILVLISLVPVVFPALFSETFFETDAERIGVSTHFELEPFELGVLAIPLIVTNIGVLIFFIFLWKKQLWRKIDLLLQFEIGNKIIPIIIIIIGIYAAATFSEIGFGQHHSLIDEEYVDWERLKNRIINMQDIWPDQITAEPHFKHTLLKISQILFGNFFVVPYVSSIGLLIVTYLFTTKISKSRTAGLISLLIVLQSNLFLTFDTSPSYASFWILLFVLSLYMMIRSWPLSPIFYILSLFSKLSVIAYAPMSIFFVLNSNITKQKKIIVAALTLLIFAATISIATTQNFSQTEWEWNEFWIGFTAFAFQMRLDSLIILFLLPLVIGLFIISKRNRYALSILVMIGCILLIAPITTGLSNETNQPYRFLSLVVFFAVGVGLLFSKIQTK